jgi:hypothetical protein
MVPGFIFPPSADVFDAFFNARMIDVRGAQQAHHNLATGLRKNQQMCTTASGTANNLQRTTA